MRVWPLTIRIEVKGRQKAARDIREVIAEVETRFGPRVLESNVFRKALDLWGLGVLDAKVQDNLAGDKLKRRTGQLATRTKVVTGLTASKGKGIAVEIQSRDVPYASIQESGGTIRAKNKLLTVPLPAALTNAGVLRKTAAEFRKDPGPFGRTGIIKSKKGNLLVVGFPRGPSRVRGARNAFTPLFVLKKSVEIPASEWASSATDEALPELPAVIRQAFDQEFRRGST